MTEYWVSQSKFYCKFCKIWMGDNKPVHINQFIYIYWLFLTITPQSRSLHDSSDRHKSQVEYFHKKQRDDKLYGAKSEKDLQQQLAAIERAARDAISQDRSEAGGMFYQAFISCHHCVPICLTYCWFVFVGPVPIPRPLRPTYTRNFKFL
jgi:hypothetical protein